MTDKPQSPLKAEPVFINAEGKGREVPLLRFPDGSTIHLMPYTTGEGNQDPTKTLLQWLNAWTSEYQQDITEYRDRAFDSKDEQQGDTRVADRKCPKCGGNLHANNVAVWCENFDLKNEDGECDYGLMSG